MSLQISGKVISVLEEESGTSQNGEWRHQSFILETSGEYPKEVCIKVWGDRIDEFGVTVGESLTAHINLRSIGPHGRSAWSTSGVILYNE